MAPAKHSYDFNDTRDALLIQSQSNRPAHIHEQKIKRTENIAHSISNGSLEKGRRKMAIDQPTNEKKAKKKMKIKRIVSF